MQSKAFSLFLYMESELAKLKEYVNAISPFDQKEFDLFASLFRPFVAKRKEILTKAGSPERHLYFVTSGVQRVFYQDSDREATLVFTYAPSFAGVLDAMLEQRNASYNFETLSNSSFLRAPYTAINQLSLEVPAVEALMKKALHATLRGLLLRMTELQCFSAEERFRAMLTRSPHILQHVPHKYLANYLGIDASNFSKFINRIII